MVPSQITEHHRQRNAVVYLRTSALMPAWRRTAIRRRLQRRCHQWGWPQIRIIAIQDDRVAGTAADRPGFRRLRAAMEADQVGLVVIQDLSRLGRDPREVMAFLTTAQQHDVLVLLSHGRPGDESGASRA